MENEKKYSVIELAELLGVPRTTINDWLSKYSAYIDFSIQGKRRVYTESSVTVLKEISTLRNSGMPSMDIEAELAKRHPLRAEPETAENRPGTTASETSSAAGKKTDTGLPIPKTSLPERENEFQLIARRQSEELGKMIGDTFHEMGLRMEELERLNRAQQRRAKIWMAIAVAALIFLLFGILSVCQLHKQMRFFSQANQELQQEAVNNSRQLQELQRQSVELITGTENFRNNIALLEKQLEEQKQSFEKNINMVRQDFEKAAAAHQSQLSAEKEKNAALLKMKEAELALEKEKFAAERLKFLRDIERMSTDNENIVNELKRQIEERKTSEKPVMLPETPPTSPAKTNSPEEKNAVPATAASHP